MPDKSYISGNVENGPIFDILVGNLLAYRPEEWGWSEQDYQKISSDFGVAENDLYHLPVANYVILNYPDNLLPSGANTDVEDYRLQVYSIQSDELTKYLLLYIGNRIYKATITAIGQTPNWEDITEYGADGLKIISFHIGDKAPSDTSKIWIDTSKLASDGYITLFFYDAASGEWKNYYVNGLMDKSIYDTQNKNTDPFLYVMDQIEAIIGDYAEFIRHKNNELTLIHVTSEEKEYYNTQLISKNDLTNMFSPGGSVYEELLAYIKNSASDKFNIDKFTDDINGIKEKLQNHIDNHITAEKVTSWINKADGDHTHDQDGKVTIHGTDIKGDPYTSDQLPNNIKERVTIVNSEDERLALTIDQVQNGDAVCVEDEDGNLVWYRVIDDTKLGKVPELQPTVITNILPYNIKSICYGNDKFVAVSLINSFIYSTDGITWTETSNELTDNYWSSICYGKDKYVAVASQSNTVAYSSDGINWTETTNGLSDNGCNSICYGNDKFVIVPDSYFNTFAYSFDGINWTETTNELTNQFWKSICYGNGKYVAISYPKSMYQSATFAYSTDGINWTETSNGLSNRKWWSSICYGNGKYVAVGGRFEESNTFVYSSDGINWTETSNGLTERDWNSICYGKDKYVAVSYGSNTFAYSSDGINWIETSNGLNIRTWSSICYGKDKYVAVASVYTFAYSTDGIIWNENIYDENNICGSMYSIIGNNSESIIYGDSAIYNLNNEFKFNKVNISNDYDYICYGNGKYIAIKHGTTFIYSTDGITWTETSNELTDNYWSSICYGKDKYVAVAYGSNTFTYSSDGITWTETTNGLSTRTWSEICYGKDKYVAVARNSNIFAYSTDGINWTETNTGLSNEWWLYICYCNNKYIITINGSNTFIYSIDGINWINSNFDIDASFIPLQLKVYDNQFVLLIANEDTHEQKFMYSNNGDIWNENPFNIKEYYIADFYKNKNKYIVISINSNLKKSQLLLLEQTPSAEEAFIKFTSTILETSFSNIKNKPTTLEGYGITDGADKSKLDAIEERIENNLENLIYVPNGYDNTNIGENELYVGVQKSLSAEGGGTIENPMSYNNSLLDIVTCTNSSNEIGWKETTNGLSSRYWNSICYGNGKYVAIAGSSSDTNSNVFAYSTDGITWTETNTGLSSIYWNSICYGNGKYVVASTNFSNTFAYSTDGITWTETSNGLSSRYWNSICYGKDKYVAVSGNNTNAFAYSTDGITWTETTEGLTGRYWMSICYGNGKFVAISGDIYIGSSVFAYSTDGITWTETTEGLTGRYWMSICYGNGKFVAVSGNYSDTFAYSTDGITWTETSNGLNSREWYSICYGNGKYVATASSSNTFAYSTDGITWTETSNGLNSREWYSICYGNGKYIVVSSSNIFAYSNSIINIVDKFAHLPEKVDIKIIETTNGLNRVYWQSICYGKDKYVAVSLTNTFAYSSDGITWTETTNGISRDNAWYSVCYGNDKYVAAAGNIFAYSSDGINWTETSNGISERNWYSICYGKDKYVAVAYNSNTFAYSSDSINWTETTNGLSSRGWESICYGNGKYVAVSFSNTFAYSSDGINWTETSNGLSNKYWQSICYGKDKYVAVADNSNTFAYSSDGITWTETTNGINSRYWQSICYGNRKYVAVSSNNTFAYSSDGINWTETSNGLNSRQWSLICYGNDKYVAVVEYFNVIGNVYFLETPKTIGGFAKFSTTYTKDDYFSTLYQTDEENPKYASDGLGMMVKVDTTQNNIVCDKTYNIGDKAIKLLIGYDIEKGLYFKTEMGETVKSLNSMYDVLMRVGDPLLALLNGYKAKFPPPQYTITFKTDAGGTINNGTDDITYTLESGQPFPEIPSVTSDFGYKFDNWYDSSNSVVSEWPTTVTKNETYTAKYNVIPKYTITFNAGSNCTLNGGNKTYTVLENDPFPAIPTIIPNSEYEIDGWYDSNNVKVVSWPKTVTKNETYTAKVTAIPKYTITFKTDGNGTLSGTTSFTLLRGSKFPTVPTNTPNSGYKFDNWYSSNGTKVTLWPSTVTKSETYTAKYIKLEIKWYETSNGLSNRAWNSICYGNGKYVVVVASYSNTFAYSTDGIAWTETSNGLNNRNWYSICYGNGKYVAVSGYNNTFAYSTNGINWTETTNGISYRTWRSICYGNGKYVATAWNSNTFAYSTDGINWTETNNGIGNRHWWSICYGNGKYVAVANGSNTFAYSSDGINWTETSNGLNNRDWHSICYGNGKYVAVAQTSNTFAYSTNGINWTETTNGISYRSWQSICYNKDKYVAVASSSNTFVYSTDGINWTETSNGISSRNWFSICYGKDKYVAVAQTSNTFAYSTLIPE